MSIDGPIQFSLTSPVLVTCCWFKVNESLKSLCQVSAGESQARSSEVDTATLSVANDADSVVSGRSPAAASDPAVDAAV